MSDTHETIADIIAEKRQYADDLERACNEIVAEDSSLVEKANDYKRTTIADIRQEADRLEAAHRRELSKNTSKNGADFGQLGDAAKLREALELCVKGMCGFCRMDAEARGMATECVNGCEALRKAKSALAASPRNCDLARDWMRDLYAHFQPPASVKREMPPEWVDAVMAFCRWLVATATEKKGGNDGNE